MMKTIKYIIILIIIFSINLHSKNSQTSNIDLKSNTIEIYVVELTYKISSNPNIINKKYLIMENKDLVKVNIIKRNNINYLELHLKDNELFKRQGELRGKFMIIVVNNNIIKKLMINEVNIFYQSIICIPYNGYGESRN